MPIKCIVIDDEPLAIKVLEQHILKIDELELVATFKNPVASMELLHASKAIDLIFLDIQMPLITGIEFIKNIDLHSKIIFTTAHREYAIEGYEPGVVDYLLKPVSFVRFFKAINKYRESITNQKVSSVLSSSKRADHLYVNSNKKYIKIEFDHILYVESIKDYIRIHTHKGTIMTKDRISAFRKKLPLTFLRVHRSYIINKDKITAFTAKDVELGKIEIPIGETYKEVIKSLKN